uniref:Uncharacterized protein MANES_13G041200 n=1 Tax=Rhizophora mucronata TaxID=61149 RepID=A0A2P2KRE0_RHIMU
MEITNSLSIYCVLCMVIYITVRVLWVPFWSTASCFLIYTPFVLGNLFLLGTPWSHYFWSVKESTSSICIGLIVSLIDL